MGNKITFSDLVERIACESGVSRQTIRDLLKEMVTVTNEGLKRDGRVSITGLGTFGLKWRNIRKGINPQTGESIEIPAHNRIYFKPEAALRRIINQKHEHMKPQIIGEDVKPSPSIERSQVSFFLKKIKILGSVAVFLGLLLLILVGISFTGKKEKYPVPRLETKSTDSLTEVAVTEREKKRYPVPQPDLLIESTPPASETAQAEADKTAKLPDESIPHAQPQIEEKTESEAADTESLPVETSAEGKEQSYPIQKPDFLVASVNKPGPMHNIRKGDRLWTISKFFYEDPYLWPNIFRVNYDVIEDPDVLEVGRTIYVPTLEGKVGNLSRKDIINIIEGYVRVYLTYHRLGKINAPYFLWVAAQYNIPGLLDQYKNKIAESDRRFILKIEGSTRIR